MALRWLPLAALLLGACATPNTGRLYPENPATHVELLGTTGPEVWTRLHAALAKHEVRIKKELFANGEGYILCEPFTAQIPGRLNTSDYRPGEIVIGDDEDSVPMHHEMEFYLTASPTGLVRLWSDANISVAGYRPGSIRAPNIVGHDILNDTVKPLTIVKQWSKARPSQPKAGNKWRFPTSN